MPIDLRASLLLLATVAVPAHAGPDDVNPPSATIDQRPTSDVLKIPDFGFCSARPDADDYASSPVKHVLENCNHPSQTFSSTSKEASKGSHGCGGYAIAFGPLGSLNPSLHQITMTATWGDTPLTTHQDCAKARVAAEAWGERTPCAGSNCWERIQHAAKYRYGKWDAASQTCTVEVAFTSENVQYRTLILDIIADYAVGSTRERKKAKGTIRAERKGTCTTTIEVPLTKP